jgi:hypothetical protein
VRDAPPEADDSAEQAGEDGAYPETLEKPPDVAAPPAHAPEQGDEGSSECAIDANAPFQGEKDEPNQESPGTGECGEDVRAAASPEAGDGDAAPESTEDGVLSVCEDGGEVLTAAPEAGDETAAVAEASAIGGPEEDAGIASSEGGPIDGIGSELPERVPSIALDTGVEVQHEPEPEPEPAPAPAEAGDTDRTGASALVDGQPSEAATDAELASAEGATADADAPAEPSDVNTKESD